MLRFTTATAMAALLLSAGAHAEPVTSYKPVTQERLSNPEPENWLMAKGNYAGWSYPPSSRSTRRTSRSCGPSGASRPA